MQLKKNLKKILSINEVGTIIPLAVLLIVCLIVNPSFFLMGNIMDILRSSSTALICAVPVTFLLSSGAMDLSIGAAQGLGGVICALCLMANVPVPIAIMAGLGAGVLMGWINGILCVKVGLHPFIATLGTMYVVNGMITLITGGVSITNWPQDSFQIIGQGKLGSVPYLVIYAAVISIIGGIVLAKTKYGRRVLAVGGNREASFLAGIDVVKIKMSCNIMVSTLGALAGILIASRFATAQPTAGSSSNLTIMAACVIGGTGVRGGNATIIGTVLGCILIGSIQNALIVMGVSTYWLNLIFGLIMIAALYIDQYRGKALGLQ